MKLIKILTLLIFPLLSCNSQIKNENTINNSTTTKTLLLGADQTELYLPILSNKNIALVVNQTSTIGNTHLADSLHSLGVNISKILAPEHGFRGKADAGTHITNGIDTKTGIPIISIYGSDKKPNEDQLKDIDIVLFDIQDVGARFYTYLSTMHFVMEACAEQNIPVLILDRPNPNGHYVDGPILQPSYASFIGLHPIPIVHGMTLGELAQMINGEGWLKNNIKCDISIIPCQAYTRDMTYDLPIAPSPNLPNPKSVLLYPSLCLFEGTSASIGRGTNTQFQIIGHPDFKQGDYSFTPISGPGSKYPKHENKLCHGQSLMTIKNQDIKKWNQINLELLLDFRINLNDPKFFNEDLFFDKLAGTDQLRKQILAGLSADEIRASWLPGLLNFKEKRSKYLLYK